MTLASTVRVQGFYLVSNCNRLPAVINRPFSAAIMLQSRKGKFHHLPTTVRKYANDKEAGRATRKNRSKEQRVMNRAYRRVPFDERYIVTGKHTGPHIEGGSEEAQQRTALHMARQAGFFSKNGNFVHVKQMHPEFIVPDLTGFKLQPYVPYLMDNIERPKFTAKDLFEEYYQAGVQDEVDKEFEQLKLEKMKDEKKS
ncbi:RM41-like protein [Mya arenaria]|uniref:RM41-like protein n=1 Tax=Mya arenaria TaxID=6604 RepID=A0ABY7ESY5_MYAAR|nr:uncharacterized protein LOC128242919 [Mya arenaria]WAR12287.1 RM41-like protein [Mya arenaria]